MERPSAEVAPQLLGLVLVREAPGGLSGGIIVEAEAYAGADDRASHARAGRTTRTGPMFGPAGHAYVYLVYGLHHCLNVVTEGEGSAGAVLVRALLPTFGLEQIRTRRGRSSERDARLAAGPARLCEALAIDRSQDGRDLLGRGPLRLLRPAEGWPVPEAAILRGPRVGIAYAGPDWSERPWRFGIADSPALSRPFPEASRIPATGQPAVGGPDD
ncbi:MAG TPA: DNA-3-methyladenine glycosylase [Candidatus Limnocylindrales bacterium]|nr:DNA-3-methyladenine glycosylase [Candidatus Limnocylindrales bacterium]